MTGSKTSVIEYDGKLFIVMHNGKQIVIAVDYGPPNISGEPERKPELRKFLPSKADRLLSTHPIYECSNEDRDQILAACDEAVTRLLSSLSDEP